MGFSDKDRKIAEIADRLFALEMYWHAGPWDLGRFELEKHRIKEFQSVINEFLDSIVERQELIDAAVTLTSITALKRSVDYQRLPSNSVGQYITLEQLNQIRADFIARYGLQGDPQRLERLYAAWTEFKLREMEIMQSFGVNQSTAAAAASLIENHKKKIISNIDKGQVASRSKFERAVRSARSLSQRDISTRTRIEHAKVPIFYSLKAKAAGLLILVSNGAACLAQLSLDSVGVISTAAGATASMMIPSQDR